MTYARVILFGFLGEKPTVRTHDENTIVTFSLAIHEKSKGEKVTHWYRCTAFNPPDFLKDCAKGDQILVEGKPWISFFERQGIEKQTLEVYVDRFVLPSTKGKTDVH